MYLVGDLEVRNYLTQESDEDVNFFRIREWRFYVRTNLGYY